MTMTSPRRSPPPPLDAAGLDRLALRYVERFQTTRHRLADYLRRKIRERGWNGAPVDPEAIAERLAGLGYVDDQAYAEAKAGAMARRGLGARRIGQAFHHAGVANEMTGDLAATISAGAWDAAVHFARRRRIGPFGPPAPHPAAREKQIAALIRAGHSFAIARAIINCPAEDQLDPPEGL